MASTPPMIFSVQRRIAARQRAEARTRRAGAAGYLLEDMIDDVAERLAFLRHSPQRSLIVGDRTGLLASRLGGEITQTDPAGGFAEERPNPASGYEFIASLGTLDTVNDLPGALIHMRDALAPGGLAIASFVGAGSLPRLRAAMLEADGDRPSPRMHPMVDVRAGGQLLQRAGWSDPVVDSRALTVRFADLNTLVSDLRDQALGNVLARQGPPLTRAMRDRAHRAFGTATLEQFEIITLSGWRRT